METSCYLKVDAWTQSRTQTPAWALPTERETYRDPKELSQNPGSAKERENWN